jgi:hypothetical protein
MLLCTSAYKFIDVVFTSNREVLRLTSPQMSFDSVVMHQQNFLLGYNWKYIYIVESGQTISNSWFFNKVNNPIIKLKISNKSFLNWESDHTLLVGRLPHNRIRNFNPDWRGLVKIDLCIIGDEPY